ncbi:MAG: hypothetical protein ACYDAG_06865 [Chloroflexota bacterium]
MSLLLPPRRWLTAAALGILGGSHSRQPLQPGCSRRKEGAGVAGSAVDQATAAVQDTWPIYQDQAASIPAAGETNWCYDKNLGA